MAKERKKRPIITLIIVVIGLTYIISRGWLTPVQGVVLRAISPLTSRGAGATQAVGDYVFSFLRVGTLSRAVRTLENKNSENEAALAKLSGIEIENKTLREQLRLLPKNKYKLVTADVIAHANDGGKDALIINRGTRDGIKEDMPVIMSDGIVVGKIARADNLTSTVMLLTDANFKLAAIVQGTTAPGLVHGTKGLDVSMEEVPRAEKINVGDRVVTTGGDGIFPADLLVGKIRSVEAPENEIFQSAKVTPVIDIRQARVVSVIINQ
jgi:rod shape-determining protein MreC